MKPRGPKATTEVDHEIGARIRTRREELGLSQAEVGSVLGIAYQQLHKYETGENRIAAATLTRLAEVLETDPARLLPGQARAPRKAAAPARSRDKLAEQLAIAFAKIASARERRLVVDLARQLAANSKPPKRLSSGG